MSAEPTEQALTVTELANALGFHTSTVYRKAEAGNIPGFRLGGTGPWRFFLSEVVEAGRPKVSDPWEQPARARRRAA